MTVSDFMYLKNYPRVSSLISLFLCIRDVKKLNVWALLFTLSVIASSSFAESFENIRIGDSDGFGYGHASGFLGADGLPANRGNSTIHLTPTDLLPDLNEDGKLQIQDVFDNRDAQELDGTAISGHGFSNASSSKGAQYTDISLSTAYESKSQNNEVYNAATNTYGVGGLFPDMTGAQKPNSPEFLFEFYVGTQDISDMENLYLNMVFADYDVKPANVNLTYITGEKESLALTKQNNNDGEDGLIQSSYISILFSKVFSIFSEDLYKGYLEVELEAKNEPYIAVDFLEIGTSTLPNPIVYVNEPIGLHMYFIVLFLWMIKRRVTLKNKK